MKDRVNILSENNEMTARIERRTGVLFREKSNYLFYKEMKWLVCQAEICQNGYMSDKYNFSHRGFECEYVMMVHGHTSIWFLKNTIAIIQKSPNQLFISSEKLEQGNELVVYLSKYVINATSAQYSVFIMS